MPFTFIGVCETLATQLNEDLLDIPGYKHEHYIRFFLKGRRGKYLYSEYVILAEHLQKGKINQRVSHICPTEVKMK